MRKKTIGVVVAAAALSAVSGVAFASGDSSASRLDDGKALLPQAKITEQQAISAAQGSAAGGLNEVDLEQYAGKLVFNVDVGSSDVKVDADSGKVVSVSRDD
ncbi:MAG: PepSY domain-containing protein [Solirubrobacteraceae bacterium]